MLQNSHKPIKEKQYNVFDIAIVFFNGNLELVCVVKLSIAYSGLKTDSRSGRGSYDSLSTLYRKGELGPKTICIGEFGSTRKKLYLPCTENESWVLKQSVYVHWVPLEKKP